MANWHNIITIPSRNYQCGYCNKDVASKEGYELRQSNSSQRLAYIYICGGCNRPTYFARDSQTPSPILGNEVDSLPEKIANTYHEARQCTKVGAFTACVLVCRKMLMHIAVEQGADENKSFFHYVEYLADNGYVPPNGRGWVDHIRQKGNEANHEIVLMSKNEAIELLSFIEMLLKFIYEFPARLISVDND